VSGHSNFESATRFLAAGGERGPQQDILLPGRYRINSWLFEVQERPATVVPTGCVGLVTAKDGASLGASELVAQAAPGHREFQDAAAFLQSGGQRGPQLDLLRPGVYYINPLLFDVSVDSVTHVRRGEVAVIVSNIGDDPEPEANTAEMGTERYLVRKGQRGIQREVAGPGTYYLNKIAYTPHIIPTTNITIDWSEQDAGEAAHSAFNSVAVTSKDGFEMTLSVKIIVRVLPERAPHVVAAVGSIESLVVDVIHPVVQAAFRNQASSTEAMNFMQDRQEEQQKIEVQMARELERHNVQCVSVLICQVGLPESLRETLTNKVIAEEQLSMFDAQRIAEDRRRDLENTRAQADLQPLLVRAALDVQVAEQRQHEVVLLARGTSEAARIDQEGAAAGLVLRGAAEAQRIRATGLAEAEVYALQARALGQAPVALMEVMRRVAEGHIKITPDVVVSDSDGKAGFGTQGMFSALMGRFIAGEPGDSE
jgi:regulator of protease activity HflC (stomatin/prohibitin superfamily)